MDALGREQCENAIVILSQVDNEFERCFIIKSDEGNDQKANRGKASTLRGVRGMIPKL